MKKKVGIIIAAALSAVLVIGSLAACGKKEEPAPEPAPAPEESLAPLPDESGFIDGLVGGWEGYGGETIAVPDEAKAAFEKATAGVTGTQYRLIALLASQIVSGTNYSFLVECIPEEGNIDAHTDAVLIVYADLEGNAEITRRIDLNVADKDFGVAEVAGPTGEAALVGAWTIAEGKSEDKDLIDLVDKATAELVGGDYEPVAEIGIQIVAGVNHAVLCKCTTVSDVAVTSYEVVYIYEALDGTVELQDVRQVNYNGYGLD